MGRRSERLSKQGMLASDLAGDDDVIQVVSRAFDELRCFEGHEARLGNLEISSRCGLPRSTVSRLTHTLTRMGQLVYLPRDQKYRIGPSAVAMSTSMMKGLQLRNLIRLRLQDVAEQLPGTVGFVIPDRFHLVYLEFARAANALGLHESTGSRIAMATTAAGHAYTAALDVDLGDALLAEIAREMPESAKVLRPHRRQSPLPARAWLCGRLRSMVAAHQWLRGAAVVAAIPDLRGGHDRAVVGDV
jgi:DNA-binding IclR family transcriptional regulator